MIVLRTGIPLLLSACLLISTTRVVADEGEDFWEGFNSWQTTAADLSKRAQTEAWNATVAKRPSQVPQMYEQTYVSYLKSLGKGKGFEPMRDLVLHSLIVHRVQHPGLGNEIEKLEKELRQYWTTVFKPNRTGDFLVLYNRYMAEKKYREALRIAEECYRDYGWTWEARTWLEKVLAALSYLPEMKDQLSARAEEYHDKHLTQLDAHTGMSTALSYLYADGEFDQAARLVESCLEAYKGCDWEPQFLLQAVMIHTARVDAPPKEPAKPGAKPAQAAAKPPAAAPRPAAPGVAGKIKPAQPTRVPVTPAPPASGIESARRAVAAAKRCAETYPHEPPCAEAILKYLQWALAEGREPALREEAGQVVAKYLTAQKATPNWGRLYTAGKRWSEKGEPTWMALDVAAEAYDGTESNRNDQLKVAMEIPLTNRLPCAKSLGDYVLANPDTVQARKAFATLTSLVLVGDWKDDFKEIQGMATNALAQAFPASPMFQRQQLAALATSGIEPESTEIASSLMADAKTPIQREWAYYWNHYRYIQHGRYSVPAFKLWVESYKDSYPVPEQLAIVTARACYNQKPEEASEACNAAACKELANSLTMAYQLGANIWSWIRYARDKAIKDEESGKAVGKRKGAKVIEREALTWVNEQANLIDEAQADKTDLGYFYYYATSWGDSIDFRTKRGMYAKQILKQKDYRGSYYYYYCKAYEKDQK